MMYEFFIHDYADLVVSGNGHISLFSMSHMGKYLELCKGNTNTLSELWCWHCVLVTICRVGKLPRSQVSFHFL